MIFNNCSIVSARVPDFVNFIDVEKDTRLAQSCLSRSQLVERYTEDTVRKQELLVQAEVQLR